MKFLVAVLMMRLIMNFFGRKGYSDETESRLNTDTIHPAETELREHFSMRCSEETLTEILK